MVLLTEILPVSSSSTSTHDPSHRYDVFLSFRGADTRNGFTDNLYNDLMNAGVVTFLDDEEIETGEPLKPELESAIQSSRASVIVLSKNYASSTWCLDELLLILDQMRNSNHIVIPIFYHVEPTNVRKQQSSFGEAMEKHKLKMETEIDADKRNQWAQKMESWKNALTEVADLKGISATGRKESEVIEEVVTDIHHQLGVLLSNTLPVLIGMDRYIKLISSWLTDGSQNSVDILTIVGIGGIGKTSLAEYVYQLHSSKFHKSSFIKGINTRCSESFNGLLDLQKQLHRDISKKIKLNINDISVYTSMIENVLARKRVFIVLDDIGILDQLDALLGNKGLHPGSKVIITSKDASLTQRCALLKSQVHPHYKEILLNGLYEFESLTLLCMNAFHSQNPKEGYEEVSKRLVKYCHGHPLAIKVLGRTLLNQDVAYWEEFIKVLKKEPPLDINTTLKISFDVLPFENDKDLFKHIACFFVGIDRNVTETILDACGINTKTGIRNLVDGSLLSIESDNELAMHPLIQTMGRDLVRQESPMEPCKRSRLWCPDESFKVLKQKKGKGSLIGLALDTRMLDEMKSPGSFELKTKSFNHMDNLMLLKLNYVQLNGRFKKFPEELRWLCMHGSPLKSIPLDLPMENLVVLDMSYSNIESFDMSCSNPQPPAKRQKRLTGSSSKDNRLLGTLKILDLSFCEQLHSVGGFFELPALERLIVRNCISLTKVCESVEQCDELVHIDLSYCYMLRKLPKSIRNLMKVKTIMLDGCNSRESEIGMWNVKAIPSDFKFIMTSLPSMLRTLSLVDNNLSNESFPLDFSCLSMLKELYIACNPIVSMPGCVRTLPRLEKLNMNECLMMISIENPPCTLRILEVYVDGGEPVLKKIKFDPEMSPLTLEGYSLAFPSVDIEVDGMVKIQDMASVEEKVLHSLGWTDLDFFKGRRFNAYDDITDVTTEFQTKMCYEFGIFGTFYEGKEMPDWISCRSTESSISFTIPSSPKKLRGLNFFYVEAFPSRTDYCIPFITISNITKKHTWSYTHYVRFLELGEEYSEDGEEYSEDGEECHISFLSHWMFGPNEMKVGDHITITLGHNYRPPRPKECGIGIVYEDDDEKIEEEDALGYYKSWNHIIGGDLSAFQLTTGEYILDSFQFRQFSTVVYINDFPLADPPFRFKEETYRFKAFSGKRKSDEVPCDAGNAIQLVDAGGILALANASSIEQKTLLEGESEAKVNGMILEMDTTEVIATLLSLQVDVSYIRKTSNTHAKNSGQRVGGGVVKERSGVLRAFTSPPPSLSI